MRRLVTTSVVLAASALVACGDDKSDPTWTVFIYGHADHNLSASLVNDMAEMSKARLSDNFQLVVMADWDSSQMSAEGDNYPSGTEWYRVAGNGKPPELLESEGEQNLDDPAVLQASIEKAFTKFPADRYGLILWDHGGAWEGGYGSDSQNGTNEMPIAMPVPPLARAVKGALDKVGLDGKRPLQFFAFDTCLMGGVEVVSELEDLAPVYIANAEIDYGDGWDYDKTMTFLSDHPATSPRDFAAKEVELWDAHHAGATTSDKLLRSHVAIDLTKLAAFRDSYKVLATDVVGAQAASGIELGKNAFFSLPAYSSTVEAVVVEPSFRDVGQFLDRMVSVQSDDALADAADGARDALAGMVIGRSLGALREDTGQAGVHIELSLANKLTPDRLAAYQERATAWATSTGWGDALAALVALSDATGPAIKYEIVNGANPDADHLPTINFSVSDPDVADARVEVAVRTAENPNVIVRHGLIGAGVVDPTGASLRPAIVDGYSFIWDAKVPAITDGAGGAQPVFVMSWMDLGADVSGELRAPILALPGIFTSSDGEQAQGVLLFQDGDVGVELAVITEPESVTFTLAELRGADPNVTFTPLRPATDISTGEVTAIAGAPFAIPEDGKLPVAFVPAAAGNYLLVTTARDVWGNEGVVSDPVTLTAPIAR